MFKSGKKLSKLPDYKSNLGGSMDPASGIGTPDAGWENVICKIGLGDLVGDEITGIIITYDKPASSGSYLAYFDDILISTKMETTVSIDELQSEKSNQYIFTRNNTLVFNESALNSRIKIYDLSGKLLSDFILGSIEITSNLTKGLYIILVINNKGVYGQKVIL
jgi:hypothetical protein